MIATQREQRVNMDQHLVAGSVMPNGRERSKEELYLKAQQIAVMNRRDMNRSQITHVLRHL